MTENTFSFVATTWGIVTGERMGMNEPIANWGLLGDRDGPDWEFSQDTGFNTPTLTISALGSLINDLRESGHPFNIPSERQYPTQQCPV